jgi:hypothetical protein
MNQYGRGLMWHPMEASVRTRFLNLSTKLEDGTRLLLASQISQGRYITFESATASGLYCTVFEQSDRTGGGAPLRYEEMPGPGMGMTK